jgi:Kef-type K+ transport system membrane component KefB
MNHFARFRFDRHSCTSILLYGLILVITALAFGLILDVGNNLTFPMARIATAAPIPATSPSHGSQTLLHLLVALVVVVVACQIVGNIFHRLGQPAVIGEVIAGILIGPSCLGRFAPGTLAALLPPDTVPVLGMFAQFGIILYMFLVGLEFDAAVLKRRTHSAIAISHASIVFPFLLGAGLALILYPILSNEKVPFRSFALFLGVSMSVTAFPVLARILTDRRIQSSPLGLMALTCAAIDDVTAWCLLALVVGVTQTEVGTAIGVTLMTMVYIAAMFFLIRPLLTRLKPAGNPVSANAVAATLIALFCSACITECIGIHAIFGAFLLGAVIPTESAIAQKLRDKLEDLVTIVLLPIFFAFAGLRTEIGLVSGWENWLLCSAIILTASIGKFGGTTVAARMCGIDWRNSCALGILMNTRGLMELIVLNIGLDLGLISPRLYTLMVLMAIVTTMMTTPVLKFFLTTRLFTPAGDANREYGRFESEPVLVS